jgi:hypothetical protein
MALMLRYFCLLALLGTASQGWGGDALQGNSSASRWVEVADDRPLRGLVRFPSGIYFRPGANKREVLAVMGSPTRIADNVWYYGDSEVIFSVSVGVPVVVGYYIRSVPLRVYDRDPFLF